MSITNKSDEISLKDFILKVQEWSKYLFSKWYIIFISGIIGSGLGVFYAYAKKINFKASTTFVLESGDNNKGGLGQMAGLAALAGVDLGLSGGGIFQGDNLFELYKSRNMIESTLLLPSESDNSILLIDRYLAMENLRKKWEKDQPELLKINFSKPLPKELLRVRDSILQKVVQDINKNNLIVDKLDKKLSIIKVDVKSSDELFSKEFNEALVSQVNAFYVKTKTKKSLANIDLLQHKTDSVRAIMNNSIATAAITIDATPNLNPTKQAQRIVPTQRSQFSAETNKAILSQLIQNLEMSKLALLKEAPLIQKVDEPILPLETDRIGKVKAAIIGGILLGILTLLFLIARRQYTKVMKS